mmetsp:Transcript_15961/g.36954  ORF Transcript_15961/g.36954 Transcript_15961/m.36954 type:complete len:346 (-) Transcript_15961:273-1310(-)
MTGMDQAKNHPSSLFQMQRGESYGRCATSLVRKKRDAPAFITLPEFNLNCDGKSTETIRKALSVLTNGTPPFCPSSVIENSWKDKMFDSSFDANSVSTASLSSASSISCADEGMDIDTDQESEIPNTSLTPDALFIVQGKEFPCHAQLLSKHAQPLHQILCMEGVMERKTKKQRASSSRRDQLEIEDGLQAWSSQSGIMVVRLSNDVDTDYFESFMEFLYTKKINLRLPADYQEDSEEEDPWLTNEEDIIDNDDVNENDEDYIRLQTLSPSHNDDAMKISPLKFLQGFFSFADHFDCKSLKSAIEDKIYDEFLYSFTAKELFDWAAQNKCTFLTEKAKEKLQKES